MNPSALSCPRGPLMIDVAGTALSDDERARLRDPRVGGVILFARNFTDSEQLQALTAELQALRSPPLIIGVDHEGGRVQRFRSDGFTRLPAMRSLGRRWTEDRLAALDEARATGFVLGAELRAHGITLSFAPVLDLDYDCCSAIGSRAFHAEAKVVARLAQAVVAGMHAAGVAAVGKHFPGHGFVRADSHHEVPVDERDFASLWQQDIAPYQHRLLHQLAGVMPAHVIYPVADPSQPPLPAGFSTFWLQEVLRQRLGFKGIIFTDDLNMAGAHTAGDISARCSAAAAAGCDMLLVCNRPDLVEDLLANWTPASDPASLARLAAFSVSAPPGWLADPFALELHPAYRDARDRVQALTTNEDPGASMTAAQIGSQRVELLVPDP
ncbi:MAG: beta-N-acetylhexosaminidase [Thauera sp.]|nr:beta-N-acetylhexosaminidase [Thauera sp.]